MKLFSGRRDKRSAFGPKRERLIKSSVRKGRPMTTDVEKPAKDDGRDWSKIRIRVIICIFCGLWIGLWGRAWYLQMIEGPRLADKARRQHMASELVSGRRGLIYDRNGQVLARSVEAKSIYARPAMVEDVPATAARLAAILNMPEEKLKGELSRNKKRFIWLKRKVDDSTAEEVRRAALPGIGLSKEYDRFYPFKHMAGQLLGFVGMDDKGLEGIERSLDDRLGSEPVRQIVQRDAMGRKFYLRDEGGEPVGENVILTLDMRFQFIAEEAMARVVREYDARWGGALIVDVKSGDILAWAQYPFFNPNTYRESSPQFYRNRLAADALEPGSTFKPLVMAAALQEKKVTPNTLINCEGGKWEYKNFTIRDTSVRGILPASKVMRYSSNIGMAKIGQSLGARQFHKYLNDLGFGETANVPVANSRGILRAPKDWGEFDIMATSFGQSISVTGLQMAQAYLTLLNHGVYKPLRLVMDKNNVEEMPKRIFSEKTVREVVDMMRDVVEEADGTGKRARIDGIEIGGKTGTAQKADERAKSYGSKRLASFVGFLPAKDPAYLILVLVDEPTRNQYGGIVAAPAFKEIASRLMTQSGILDEKKVAETGKAKSARQKRGLKLAKAPGQPWQQPVAAAPAIQKHTGMNLPGHLARASGRVPDVRGKSVRNAVELFARAGIVPELRGSGGRVVRQTPPAGSPWPEPDKKINCTLWLSER